MIWLIGPFLLVLVFMLVAWRRAVAHGTRFTHARAQSTRSDAALTQAMADAVTRLRGQDLARRARYEALELFLQQIVEGLPTGVIVVSPQGHVRLVNRWAASWLHLPDPVAGQLLSNIAGTEALQSLAAACVEAQARRDGTATGPGELDVEFPVTAVPLTTSAGEVDGVLCLVHHERVS